MSASFHSLFQLKPGTLLMIKKQWSAQRPGPGSIIMFVSFENELNHMWALTDRGTKRYVLRMYSSSPDGVSQSESPWQIFNEYFEVVNVEKNDAKVSKASD